MDELKGTRIILPLGARFFTRVKTVWGFVAIPFGELWLMTTVKVTNDEMVNFRHENNMP